MMNDTNFEKALTQTLKNEGVVNGKTGYVNRKSDKGGETNYGITIAKARAYGYGGAMRDMPFEIAKEIYYRDFWRKSNAHNIANFNISFLLFDFAVNTGVKNANKVLQKAINKALSEQKLKIDGIIGEKTLYEIKLITLGIGCLLSNFQKIFISEILSYYTSLKNPNTGFAKNGAGWVNRVVKNIYFLMGIG